MPDSLAFTTPAGDFGTMDWADGHYLGPLPPDQPDFRPAYDGLIAAGVVPIPYAPPVVVAPDCTSLAFWLTALDLWTRQDSTGTSVTRTADVQAAVAKLVSAGNPLGKLAARQLEYANTALRADLLRLAPAFGFSPADVDESLWRADRVRQGDLTGVWPPPTSA